MPHTNERKPLATSHRRYHHQWLMVFLILFTALMLTWITTQRQADFRANQVRLASTSATATANEITLTISELRRNLTVFASERAALLDALLFNPDDEDRLDQLQEALTRHFPEHFSYSLSHLDGTVVIDDVEGRVGDVCLKDLRSFAKTRHPYEVFTHPNPVGYHFDLPVTISHDDELIGVLMVGFSLDSIARRIGSGQLPDHQLILVKDDDQTLIEATEDGSRNQLGREFRLSEEEVSRILVSQPVQNTRWTLLDLPDAQLFRSYNEKLYLVATVLFLFVLLVSGILYWFLAREEQRRVLAEQQVHHRNEELAESLATLQEAQEQLIESEKLASLGGLVAGVAHEINTPVGVSLTSASVIATGTQEMRSKVDAGDLRKSELESYLSSVEEGARILGTNLERAAELIKSFKQIAVDRASEMPRKFLLAEHIDEVLISLRPKLKHSPVQVAVQCPDELWVNTQPGALAQILTNLILNSLTHGYELGESGKISIDVNQIGPTIHLLYTDDGRGIPESHFEKVFEPFFTTAWGKGGSGLGMNLIYNYVKKILKGHIALSENKPRGVGVVIDFPADLEQVQG
ncbi:MAG: ATP-binding protein [bacterium]